MNDLKLQRPVQHLQTLSQRYPQAWRQVESLRNSKGKDLPDWPPWCFLPMAGWYAIVSGGGDNRVPPELVADIGRLAALGTWRYSQGIYRFHPLTLEALWDTPLNHELPTEVLLRLPEWCVYIETPGKQFIDAPMYGFWAHLERDANNGRRELRLLLDLEDSLLPLPIHLGDWTLAEALERMVVEGVAQGTLAGFTQRIPQRETIDAIAESVQALVSLLLYLCSDEPDVVNRKRPEDRPQYPRPTRVKGGERLFPVDHPRIWTTGETIGNILEQAAGRGEGTSSEPGDKARSSPRPHLRRAHWHGFWHGPVGERQFRYKWLPPIIVDPLDK